MKPWMGLAAALATVVPVLLWHVDSHLLFDSYGKGHRLFEYFGFCVSPALAIGAWLADRRTRGEARVAIGAFLAVAFAFLTLRTEYAFPSYDYFAYEHAAKAMLEGTNPYAQDPPYLYPPLTARLVTGLYGIAGWFAGTDEKQRWEIVFYLWCCAQYFAILLCFRLGWRLSERFGVPERWAPVAMAALLIANNPVFRTIRHGQTNLLVLACLLAGLLHVTSRPAAAGLSIAVGTHLKLYPGVLLPVWLASGARLAGVWGVAGVAALALGEAAIGGSAIWTQFGAYAQSIQQPDFLRNNSLYSLTANLLRALRNGDPAYPGTIQLWSMTPTLAVVGWMAWRTVARRGQGARGDAALNAYSVDALILMLLISPSVWEHHYTMAIPMALYGIGTQWAAQARMLMPALVLLFAVPTFDVFPFSYHRLAGLLMLAWIVRPAAVTGGSEAVGNPSGRKGSLR